MESSVIRRIHRLRQMTVGDLQLEWFRTFGELPRVTNRDHLWKRLAWKIQEDAYGGLSGPAKTRAAELALTDLGGRTKPNAAAPEPNPAMPVNRSRDPRLPSPGTVLTRRYRDRELRLVVHTDHFELDGQAFRSLSEAARHVTGSRWNGRLFWGLTSRKRG